MFEMSSAEMALDALMPPPTAAVGLSRGSLLDGAVGAAATTAAVGALLVGAGDDCEHAPSRITARRPGPSARISPCIFMRSSHDGSASRHWRRAQGQAIRVDGRLGDALVRVTREHPLPTSPTKLSAQLSISQQAGDCVA